MPYRAIKNIVIIRSQKEKEIYRFLWYNLREINFWYFQKKVFSTSSIDLNNFHISISVGQCSTFNILTPLVFDHRMGMTKCTQRLTWVFLNNVDHQSVFSDLLKIQQLDKLLKRVELLRPVKCMDFYVPAGQNTIFLIDT